MSEHALNVLAESKLVVLSGLAGGGRNTTINYLVEHDNYFFLVSDTTRPPKLRSGMMEQDGTHYYFRKEADMLREIRQGEFIEAEIIHNQQVSGTSIRELERANKTGKTAVHDFEFGGASNIAAAKPDAHIIGLLPPSYDEWLIRLQQREVMHEEEFINRLHTAEKVLENMLGEPYFSFVINTTVPQCAEEIRDIVENRQAHSARQKSAKKVAVELLAGVRHRLEVV